MSEECDCRRQSPGCRSTGLHEHRFLKLPASAGLKPGQRCTILLPT